MGYPVNKPSRTPSHVYSFPRLTGVPLISELITSTPCPSKQGFFVFTYLELQFEKSS